MGKEPRVIPDDETGNPFLSLGYLDGKVPTATLAKAIEDHGIFFRLDKYDIARMATDKEELVAREALAEQHRWEKMPERDRTREYGEGYCPPAFSGLLDGKDLRFDRFGWAKEVVPDELVQYLDNVRQDPGTQDLWRDLVQPMIAINRLLAKWYATSDLEAGGAGVKEARLDALKKELADLEQKAQVAGAAGHKPKSKGDLNHDQELQARADQIAEQKRAETGRSPTRNTVAHILATQLGRDTGTVLRRIRKKWP